MSSPPPAPLRSSSPSSSAAPPEAAASVSQETATGAIRTTETTYGGDGNDENNDSDSDSETHNNNNDEESADLPMTLAASVVLDSLPRDAHAALETAGELYDAAKGQVRKKVKIRLSPLAATPALRQPIVLCAAAQRFAYIVAFVRSRLKLPPHAGLHCYVNSVFAPALDEGVGNLWRCFKTGDELVVSYSLAQAFG